MAMEIEGFFGRQKIVVSVTSTHAPLAERMVGYFKGRVFDRLQGALRRATREKKGEAERSKIRRWQLAGPIVDEYNQEHKRKATNMTPNEAAMPRNHDAAKEFVEVRRRSDSPQRNLDEGHKVGLA